MFVYNFKLFYIFLNVWLWKTKKVFCSVVYMKLYYGVFHRVFIAFRPVHTKNDTYKDNYTLPFKSWYQ